MNTMRQWSHFALLLGTVILGLTAAGCARRESDADRAIRDGVLLQGLGAQAVTLDPHRASSLADGNVLRALLEGLVTVDPQTLEPRPGVAAGWEISPDGLSYTFHLRDNARWSNGDPVTAGDFVNSIRRALAPDLGTANVYLMEPLRGAIAFNRGETTDFSTVGAEALDERTLRLTLAAPTPHFLGTLTHFVWLPVHLPSIRAVGPENSPTTPWTTPERFVGNGPFRLVENRAQQFVRLEASPTYWDAAALRLRGIKLLAVADVQVEERTFRAGQLHITDALPIGKIAGYRERDPQFIRIAPSFALYFYRFNVTRPPLDDARVRRALAAAIDRQLLVGGPLADAHTPARSITPPLAGGYEPPALVQHDPELARRLLVEAGFPEGKGLRHLGILYNKSENHQLVAEVVQEMWRRTLGVDVTLANQEYGVFLDNRRRLNFDVCRASWFGDFLDPLAFLTIFTTGDANNQTGWSNADYDRLIAEARHALDPERRRAALTEAETILLREMPVIPLYVQSTIRLVDPRVQGWFDNPMDLHPYKAIGFAPAAP